MADTCTCCGKELGGVYQYYWGNPCHPECNPASIAFNKERMRQRKIGRDEATRATPPAAVVEAMERALRGFVHGYACETDRIAAAFYDAGTALADLQAWRAGK